jgi:hypothetical protein
MGTVPAAGPAAFKASGSVPIQCVVSYYIREPEDVPGGVGLFCVNYE